MSVSLCLYACVFMRVISCVLLCACFLYASKCQLVLVSVCVCTYYCACVFVSLRVDVSDFVCMC